MRTIAMGKPHVSAVICCSVACIHSFAAIVDMCICVSFCSLWSLALRPALLPASALTSASHSSALCRHSTLVLSLLAINCQFVELIVE